MYCVAVDNFIINYTQNKSETGNPVRTVGRPEDIGQRRILQTLLELYSPRPVFVLNELWSLRALIVRRATGCAGGWC